MVDLIPKHGGYRKLNSFQVAQLVYGVAVWIKELNRGYGHSGQGGSRRQCNEPEISSTRSTPSTLSTLSTKIYPEFSANATLVLIAVACSLLDRQVERLTKDFENEGGFSERLYRVRSTKRRKTR